MRRVRIQSVVMGYAKNTRERHATPAAGKDIPTRERK
jgi:hypothetical protein